MKKKIIDKKAFEMMNYFNTDHKKVILTHLKQLMIDINDEKKGVDETLETLKGILISVNTLKKHYGK